MSEPVAYSYIRFSSKKQEEGDSIRRQTELTTAWAKRNGLPLDDSLAPDRGISAFRGKNRDLGALGEFLKLVDSGRVLEGSYLVVESLDRLTREEIQRALLLVLQLLQKGIRVVQLKPTETIYDSKSDTTPIILMLVELSRAHSESKLKSERVTAAWDRRKELAREGKVVLTRRLPPWVVEEDGALVLVTERVRVLKKIFTLSLRGHGLALIARALERDGVATWGGGSCWRRSYLSKLLNSRAVLGECQFYKAGEPDGEPVPEYFPKVIDLVTWERVQASLKARKKAPGRVGKKVANLFTGLLWDARTRGKMHIAWKTLGRGQKRAPVRVLLPAATLEGRACAGVFRNSVFEAAVLTYLKEIDPADIAGEERVSESATLNDELESLDGRIAEIEAELNRGGKVETLARVVRTLEAQRQELAARVNAAREAEREPITDVLSEAQTLMKVATDEPARLRLRGLLLSAVSEVWTLVVTRAPSLKLCAVQLFFRCGVRRNLLIRFTPGTRVKDGSWSASTFADRGESDAIDLRKEADAALVEKYLETANFE